MHGALPQLDAETRAAERPGDHKNDLRLWLRLLTCATLIETEVRKRLREDFGETLPRFDLMAQLHKSPEGLTMSALSRRMMVSNGNLTALVERLAAGGKIKRRQDSSDRRSVVVRLTRPGASAFARMARAHEGWIGALFGGFSRAERARLMKSLGLAKNSVRGAVSGMDKPVSRMKRRAVRGKS